MEKMKMRNGSKGSPGRLSSPESRPGRPDVPSRRSARDRRGWGQTPTEGRGSVPDDSLTDRAVHIQGACPSLAGLVGGQEILNKRETSNKSGFRFLATRGYKTRIPMQKKSKTPDSSSNGLRLKAQQPPTSPLAGSSKAPSTSAPHPNPSNHPETNQLRLSRSRTAARQPTLSIVPGRTAAQIGTPRH